MTTATETPKNSTSRNRLVVLGGKGHAFVPDAVMGIVPHETDKKQCYIWTHTGNFFLIGESPANVRKVLNVE